MNLKNKNIILTGASSGIGFELAKKIAAEKCNLALLSRRIEIIEKSALSLSNTGSHVIAVKCDISNKDEVTEAFNYVKKSFGSIDAAILDSGTSSLISANEFNSDAAKQMFDVNVMGMVYCIEALLPDFIKNRSGLIVGVSSLADGRGFPRSGVYCASKAAASIFLESMRSELKKYNIKVLTVKPGFVKTPMTAKNNFIMPFLMNPDKAASIILSGIKKEKRIIQFPLPTVLGAKIMRLLPNPIFEYIAARVNQ
ncbi:MAG: SDR family NAD(P)-dependent oxidoreductase [Ignavibacteriaceae bacterium]|nr:SDR family NAD(P)-dependent oxidoreductase [Ignavibacteriaceae bacterium]